VFVFFRRQPPVPNLAGFLHDRLFPPSTLLIEIFFPFNMRKAHLGGSLGTLPPFIPHLFSLSFPRPMAKCQNCSNREGCGKPSVHYTQNSSHFSVLTVPTTGRPTGPRGAAFVSFFFFLRVNLPVRTFFPPNTPNLHRFFLDPPGFFFFFPFSSPSFFALCRRYPFFCISLLTFPQVSLPSGLVPLGSRYVAMFLSAVFRLWSARSKPFCGSLI